MAALDEPTGPERRARKIGALALAMLSATGCFTTTQATSVTTSPSAIVDDGMVVTAIVLEDTTRVRFDEPVTVAPNGSVTGYVGVPYPETESGIALRRISYGAAEISEYHVEHVEREFSLVRTLALTLGVVGAPLAWIWIQIRNSE